MDFVGRSEPHPSPKRQRGTSLPRLRFGLGPPRLNGVLFGVRRYPVQRNKLQREAVTVQTQWGPVQGKRGWRDGGPEVFTPEYEDCARVARERGVALREVYAAAELAYRRQA